MKSILVAATAATALLGAVPALAQAYRRSTVVQPGHGLREQEDALETRIREGIDQRQIDRAEADRAFRELNSIRDEARDLRARHDGTLLETDRLALQQRLDQLSRSIHWMRTNGVVVTPPYGGWDIGRRESWLEDRIQRGLTNGSLDRREGWRVLRELRRIRDDEANMKRWHRGALTAAEVATLQTRLDRLSDTIRWLRHNDERRPWDLLPR